MKVLYCDCFSGISGDMLMGALLDAGLPLDYLRAQLVTLPLPDPYELRLEEVHKGALRASSFSVDVDESKPGPERHLSDIAAMIEASQLSAQVKDTSLRVFRVLAEAEARVHGEPLEHVHFHEVGAVDSIVDIVGAAVGLEYLGIERIYSSPVPLGSGQVKTRHGLLPLPAPATLELLGRAHARTVPSSSQMELVTPTGAAVLAALATFEMPALVLGGIGTGAGKRDLPWPNVLRVILGEASDGIVHPLVLVETNIDDMNPQVYGHVMARLFAAGALDVFLTPIYMKKNRPATMLSVIARRADEAALAKIILAETTTFGMRVQPVYRYEAARTFRKVATEFGDLQVKLKVVDGKVLQAAPEYDDCQSAAQAQGVPFLDVYQAALRAAAGLVDSGAGLAPAEQPAAHAHNHEHPEDHVHEHDHGHGHSHSH